MSVADYNADAACNASHEQLKKTTVWDRGFSKSY